MHPYAQCLTGYKRHHVVELVFHVPRVVERQDIRVLEPCNETNLPDEPNLSGFRVRVHIQNLDRNFTFVFQVTREVHRRESALADLALDLVASTQRGAESREWIRKG